MLTDDEVAALAVREASSWWGPLPTVDLTAAADLAASCARGERALVVRQADLGEAAASRAWAPARSVMGSSPVLTAYAARLDDATRNIGLAVAIYQASSEPASRVVDVVDPGGIHVFEVLDREGAQDLVDESANKAYERGLADDPEVGMMLVSGTGEVLFVTEGRVLEGSVNDGGSLTWGATTTAPAWPRV